MLPGRKDPSLHHNRAAPLRGRVGYHFRHTVAAQRTNGRVKLFHTRALHFLPPYTGMRYLPSLTPCGR